MVKICLKNICLMKSLGDIQILKVAEARIAYKIKKK